MAIPYRCTACGNIMSIPERYAGREIFCTSCKQRFVVPSPGSPTQGQVGEQRPSHPAERPAATPPPFHPPSQGPPPAARPGPPASNVPAAQPITASGASIMPGPGPADTIPADLTVCDRCHSANAADQRYCARCGADLRAVVNPRDLMRTPAPVYIIAVLDGLAALAMLLITSAMGFLLKTPGRSDALAVMVVCGTLAVLNIVLAVGMIRLRPWARGIQIALAFAGLLAFPIGTLISIGILVYLFNPKAKILFSGKQPEQLSPAELSQLSLRPSSMATIWIAVVAGVVLIMVPILGIMAAIAVPNFLNALNRARQKRTVADMRLISDDLNAYAADHNSFPKVDSVEELVPLLDRPYSQALPTTDGWGRPFTLRVAEDGSSFELVSLGRDGEPDDQQGGATTGFDADIIMVDGVLWQWPKWIGG
jgi:general secretion pathway protein G